MNERLEIFRRRLRSNDGKNAKERTKIKDFLGIGISLFALVISASTAYFNLIWQSDDIRAVVGSLNLSYDSRSNALKLGEYPEWTFINSGNRSAAIRSVKLVITKKLDCSTADQTERFSYEVDPFVIKPSEILPRTFHIKAQANVGGFEYLLTVTEPITLVMCATATIITPDSAKSEIVLPLAFIAIAPPNTLTINDLFDTGRPQPLFARQAGLSDALRSLWARERSR